MYFRVELNCFTEMVIIVIIIIVELVLLLLLLLLLVVVVLIVIIIIIVCCCSWYGLPAFSLFWPSANPHSEYFCNFNFRSQCAFKLYCPRCSGIYDLHCSHGHQSFVHLFVRCSQAGVHSGPSAKTLWIGPSRQPRDFIGVCVVCVLCRVKKRK